VVKVDVEGAELAVLKGAAELLKASKPLILSEAHGRRDLNLLIEWLAPLGYRHGRPAGFSRRNHLFTIGRP
jgi:hypothetical protein